MKDIKLLIFDLDGTIADTLPSIVEAVNRTLAMYKKSEKTYEEIRIAVGHGAKDLIRKTFVLEPGAELDAVFANYEKRNAVTWLGLSRFCNRDGRCLRGSSVIRYGYNFTCA